jgi:ABC-2 type transporter
LLGLDAFSALQVIQTLKDLASSGRTILITIHQPRSDIFFLFDFITLLSGGQTVYSGPVANTLTYFDNLSFPCPPRVNPADHLIDLSTIDTRTSSAEETTSTIVSSLIQSWKRHQLTSSAGPDAVTSPPEAPIKSPGVSTFRQIWYLTTRNFWITIRDPYGLGGFLFEGIFIGVFVGWIFYQIPGSLTGIRSMQGFIYTVIGLQGYLLLLFTTWKVSVDMRVSWLWYATEGRFTIARDKIKCIPRWLSL